MFEIKIC